MFEAAAYPWIGPTGTASFALPQVEALPVEAATDRLSFERSGVRSSRSSHLSCRERSSAHWRSAAYAASEYGPPAVAALQLLADGFASVLARQRADGAVRESDERRRQAAARQRQRGELAHALRVTTSVS
jgi:hypothetical protein